PGALPPPAAELFRAMSAPDVPAPAPQPPLSTAGLGLPVATTDRDGDGRAEIVIGRRADPAAGPAPDVVWTFPGGSPIASAGAVRVFDPLERALEAELSPFGDFAGGVFVGGA
ncbi:MAG TPA: hypothetical protein VIL46_02655, partial [Gemmataceae bacterium]